MFISPSSPSQKNKTIKAAMPKVRTALSLTFDQEERGAGRSSRRVRRKIPQGNFLGWIQSDDYALVNIQLGDGTQKLHNTPRDLTLDTC